MSRRQPDTDARKLAWDLAGELANDTEITALIEEAERAPPVRRRSLTWTAIAFCMLVLAAGVHMTLPRNQEIYTTGVGERRVIVLPDQSRVTLNTASQIRVNFERGVRAVELDRGEATFEVTHDATRPFEVHAANGIARALGTEFNVQTSLHDTIVAVLDGKVEVLAPSDTASDRPPSKILARGQEVTYRPGTLSSVRTAKINRIDAWHAGRIVFEDAPLKDAVAEMNRYSTTPLSLADSSLAEQRVSGVFRSGETEALVRALEHALSVRVERRHEGFRLHSAQPTASTGRVHQTLEVRPTQ